MVKEKPRMYQYDYYKCNSRIGAIVNQARSHTLGKGKVYSDIYANHRMNMQDMHISLRYYEKRYYDLCSGVWLSVDPMHSERSWLTPYNYVQNNPINRIDPDGMLDGEFEWDNANKKWQKTSTKGDDIGVDFYHWDGAGGSQTTYVTDREGNWNTITNGREALQGTLRDESVDWKQIYNEWKSGTGPEYSLMEGEHPSNQEINKDFWLNVDHRLFLNSGDSKGRYDRRFGILGALDAGANMQLQMMGSYSTSFYKLGDKTLTLIFDSKSRTSFYYHAGIPNYSRQTGWPKSTGMGKRETTTYQTYIFFK